MIIVIFTDAFIVSGNHITIISSSSNPWHKVLIFYLLLLLCPYKGINSMQRDKQ